MRAVFVPTLLVAALGLGCASERGSVPRPSLVESEPAPPPPPLADGAGVVVDPSESPPKAPEPESGRAGEPEGRRRSTADPVLAYVGARPVLASELLQGWLQRDSIGLKSLVNVLVSGRLAQLEAERLGLRLPPAQVREGVERNLDRLRLRLLGEQAEAEDLDAFVREQLDLDPVRYRERLRRDTLRELVTERVVRAWTLANEYARVRILLVEEAERAEAILDQLAEGADFARLARENSLDTTGERGGLVPFLLRNDRAPLSRLAFDTEVGEVGGPIELAGAQVLLRVEGRPEPLTGDWDAVALAVEDSLLDHPVRDEEWLAWQLAMERRWGVDLEPLYQFLDEPFR